MSRDSDGANQTPQEPGSFPNEGAAGGPPSLDGVEGMSPGAGPAGAGGTASGEPVEPAADAGAPDAGVAAEDD